MPESGSTDASVRRLAWVVGAVVFIDTLFYAVVSPMLPALSQQFGLSKLTAGVLTAAYPAGVLIASLPAGALVLRIGPRLTVCFGLGLLIISTVAFAFLNSILGLDIARFIEGVGSACSWAGGLAWLSAATPPSGRGEIIGRALGAAIGGALFGPAVGALASAIGRPVLFCSLVVVAAVLVGITWRLPDEPEFSGQGLGLVAGALLKPPVFVAAWLVLLPAIASGMSNVLAPLRLHHLGAGAGVIGATFVVGAGLEALLSPRIGRLSDRRGRMLPLRVGMLMVAATIVGYQLPSAVLATAMLLVALFLSLGLFWAPSMAMLGDAADMIGLDQAHAAALMNLAWAGGQIIGAASGGAAAKASGDLLPSAVVSALCLLSLLGTARWHYSFASGFGGSKTASESAIIE